MQVALPLGKDHRSGDLHAIVTHHVLDSEFAALNLGDLALPHANALSQLRLREAGLLSQD